MKNNTASRLEPRSCLGFDALYAIAAAGLLLSGLCTPSTRADVILLSAPSANSSYYGMYSPYASEASFTLGSTYHVSSISAVFRTPASASFTTFQLSLQNAVTNPPTIFASQNLTAAVGATTALTLNVNQTLPAGTYFLAAIVPGYFGSPATPGDVDGWLLSTGSYNQSAGTIVNGVYVAADPVVFDTGGIYVAPAFTVIGSVVPEPSACTFLGAAALLAIRPRKLKPDSRQVRPGVGDFGAIDGATPSGWHRCSRGPEHRPGWIRVDRLLGEHGIQQDSPLAPREFERHMEQRHLEQDDPESLKVFRRGWSLGGEEFRTKMLEFMDGRLGENHLGELHLETPDGSADFADTDGDGMSNWQEWRSGMVCLGEITACKRRPRSPSRGLRRPMSPALSRPIRHRACKTRSRRPRRKFYRVVRTP